MKEGASVLQIHTRYSFPNKGSRKPGKEGTLGAKRAHKNHRTQGENPPHPGTPPQVTGASSEVRGSCCGLWSTACGLLQRRKEGEPSSCPREGDLKASVPRDQGPHPSAHPQDGHFRSSTRLHIA